MRGLDTRVRPLGPSMSVAACLILLVAASLFFLVFPGADIAATRFFYVPGEGFPLADVAFFQALRTFSDALMWVIGAAALAGLALHFTGVSWKRFLPPNKALFLLSTLLVGPGLIVNELLKEYWGRPRPFTIDAFGGEFPYVEVWHITDYCDTNCSFVSGEGSTAIWFIALALILPSRWRALAAVPILVLATLLSVNRVAFGAHFLSDVVIAWLLTLLVIAYFHRHLIASDYRASVAAA